jgi:hypothetical protein
MIIVANIKLVKYDTLFKERALLKLEAITQWQKTVKKEARWNKLKGEFNAILGATPFPMLADEATYH